VQVGRPVGLQLGVIHRLFHSTPRPPIG
jgi:hypothetical protein